MNTLQNVAELQENFAIKLDSNIAKHVDEFDRKIIANAYLKLFSGFARLNWTNNYSLGRAWQTALGQCDAFIKTKNDKNPAAQYLKNVFSAHKPYWSRVIMTHKNRDNVIDQNSPHAKQIREHGQKMIRDAIDTINMILARYNEYTEELVATAAQTKAQQQSQPHPQSRPQAAQQPMATQPKRPDIQYAAKPAVKQPEMSGAFPTLRDTTKKPNIVKAEEKPRQFATPEILAQEQENIMHAQAEQKKPDSLPQAAQQPMATQAKQPDIQYAAKPAVKQPEMSGAFPTLRDTAKQSEIPVKTEHVEQPVPVQQDKKAVLGQPQITKPQYQPNVHFAAQPATGQIAKSGAFPTLRDTAKQSEIPVKIEHVEQPGPAQPDKKAVLGQAEQKVIAQQAQLQIQMQKRMQMWIIGQQFQNAA